jgi:AhpD family alkylhydroperoxidase
MPRLSTEFIPNITAEKLLQSINSKHGRVANIYKLMSQADNVLEGYLNFSNSLANGTLSNQELQQIALVVAGFDHCIYCASAHTVLAHKAGISDHEASNNLHGQSTDQRTAVLLKFCRDILDSKGNVTDLSLMEIREQGFTDFSSR